jgi:hypothetical protein
MSSFAKTSIEEQWRIHAGCNYVLKTTVIFSGLNLHGGHCTGRSLFQLKHDLNTHLMLHMGRSDTVVMYSNAEANEMFFFKAGNEFVLVKFLNGEEKNCLHFSWCSEEGIGRLIESILVRLMEKAVTFFL